MPPCIQPAPAAVPGAPPHACAAHVQATLQLLALSVAPPPMPALASTPPPALPRPPVDPIGFLVPSCAPSHTSAQPPPSCLQRLWRRLSSCPPFQLHLLSCRPSPLPSLLLYLDRQPNPSISLSTPSHTSTQPPPSRLRRLMWKRLCCWEPFQLGLPSHRPSPLPSLLPCRDRQPIPPAFSHLPLPSFTRNHHLPASSTAIRRSASALLGMSAQAAQLAQSVCLVHVLTLLGGRAPTPQGYTNRD